MTDPAQDVVELLIDGTRYGGWKALEIDVGYDAVASSFSFDVTDRWPGQPDRWALQAGVSAAVLIGGETVVTGYIDRLGPGLDADSHGIALGGRSRAGDLIDCSAVATPGSWSGRTLEAIAGELAAPFGITVTARASTAPPIKKFALQQGESVWEAIERMCRFRGLLAVSTVIGDIEIISPKATAPTVRLVEGEHILAISATHDVSDRFSRYIVRGQAAGDDDASGETVAGPSAEATDPAVKRYRPLIVIAEDQATLANCQARAKWEATVRAAKAQQAQVTVQGWRQPGRGAAAGALWRPGQMVALDAPDAWMQADLMVAGLSYRLTERGRTAELRVVRPEAYSQLAVPEDAKASRIGKAA